MNKPELIKRTAMEMIHYYHCGLLNDKVEMGEFFELKLPSDEINDYVDERSFKPDYYELFIPLAEMFIERLIEDKVI